MPPLLPVPGVVRCALTGTFGDAKWANIFHIAQRLSGGSFINAAAWTQPDLDALAVAWGTWWNSHFKQHQTLSSALADVFVVDLTSDTGLQSARATPIPGTNAGTADFSAQTCVCVSWKARQRYRGGHLRSYLVPGTTGNKTTPTTWGTGYTNAVATSMNNFLSTLAGENTISPDGLALVGVHRVRHGQPIDPVGTEIILSATVDTRIDTQRRRLGKDR